MPTTDVTITEIESAILTHKRELKSRSRGVTKRFFQSALVGTITTNYGTGAMVALGFTFPTCVHKSLWVTVRWRRRCWVVHSLLAHYDSRLRRGPRAAALIAKILQRWNYEWNRHDCFHRRLTSDSTTTSSYHGRVADWLLVTPLRHGRVAHWLSPIWLTANR